MENMEKEEILAAQVRRVITESMDFKEIEERLVTGAYGDCVDLQVKMDHKESGVRKVSKEQRGLSEQLAIRASLAQLVNMVFLDFLETRVNQVFMDRKVHV